MFDQEIEEEEEIILRGIIQASEHKYYVLNEIFSEEDCKQFSAIKIMTKNLTKTDNIEVDEHKFSIRCYDKRWISEEVLKKGLEIASEKIHKFFDCFKNRFDEYRTVNHQNLQQMKEFIETEDYIYVVTEFCDQNLQDFILDIKDKCFNNPTKIELKLRKIFHQIFSALFELFDLHGFTFAGLLSAREIMIIEKKDNKDQSDLIIKFPHPFFANFQTILKFFSKSFPYYLAPEVYDLFHKNTFLTSVMKKDTYDFSSLFSSTDLSYDMWALAFMMYETFFHQKPFVQNSILQAMKNYANNIPFTLYPNVLSETFFNIIEQGLKNDKDLRMKHKDLKLFIDTIETEHLHFGDFEKQLQKNIRDDLNFTANGVYVFLDKKVDLKAASPEN